MSTITSRPRRASAVRVPNEPQAAGAPAAPSAEVAAISESPPVAPTADEPSSSAPAVGEAAVGEAALLRSLHLTRVGRIPCFFEAEASPEARADRPLAAAEHAAELQRRVADSKSRKLSALAGRVLRRTGRAAESFKGAPRPTASYHSEADQVSVLRTDWSPRAAQVAVDWSPPEMKFELTLGADVVFSGFLPPHVMWNGRVLDATGDWEEVMWLSEPEADYLELEIRLGEVRLQRQILLCRRDGWLYVGDDVHAPASGDLETRLRLPTADDVRFVPYEETRDGVLHAARHRLAVVPASLPEWRAERSPGELVGDAGRLELRRSAAGVRSLNSSLFLNFHPRRSRREITWRRLTVGENLRLVGPDEAVGYRLQAGREHWLVYRSLTDWANRTLLGINLQTAFLFARFSAEGRSEPLIELEG